MNAVTTVSPGIVPANMTEAMQLAEMMASAKLVPKDLQKSPADCLMVIQQAVRWQMDPFAVAQECSVIQGKLMHSGKLVAAVVNARGNLAERLSYSYSGSNGERTITVRGRLQGETTPRTVEVTLAAARTNNRVWQSQPDQQLMYHGCRVWARRHTPELMLGVWSPEEFDEPAPANGNTIEHAPAPALPPIKRTREQISAEANKKRQAVRDVEQDLLQIDSLRALERYEREELTPEFMASLGLKQWAVEQKVGERRRELEEAVSAVNADGLAVEENEPSRELSKADFIRNLHLVIDEHGNRDSLLTWWNRRDSKDARRAADLTPQEIRNLMDRVQARCTELLSAEMG